MLDEVVPEDERLTADQRHAFNALLFSAPTVTEPEMPDYSAESAEPSAQPSLDDLLSMF